MMRYGLVASCVGLTCLFVLSAIVLAVVLARRNRRGDGPVS